MTGWSDGPALKHGDIIEFEGQRRRIELPSAKGLKVEQSRIQVFGAGQVGNRLWVCSNVAGRAWVADVFCISGMRSFGQRRYTGPQIPPRFVLPESVDIPANVPVEIPIWPAIMVDGPYRNFVESPANNAMLLEPFTYEPWPAPYRTSFFGQSA